MQLSIAEIACRVQRLADVGIEPEASQRRHDLDSVQRLMYRI